MYNRRRWLAFALAPVLPSVFFLFAFHLSDPRQAAFVLLFSIVFGYLPCLLLGVPLIRFLERRNSLNVVNITLCGSLLGIVTFYIFGFVVSVVLGSPKSVIPELREVLSGATLGASVAMPFSLIAGFPLFSSKNGDQVKRR